MNVLEKILEEIEEATFQEDAPIYVGYMEVDGYVRASRVKDIIRSHMGGAIDTDDTEEKIREHIAECLHRIDNIRSFVGSKEYTSNDEKCIRNIEVLKTIITALEGYLSSKKKSGNDGWISVEERLPNREECQKNNREFFVQDENGNRFSCEYDSESNGYDNPKWCCNTMIVAWQNFPEPYKPDEN